MSGTDNKKPPTSKVHNSLHVPLRVTVCLLVILLWQVSVFTAPEGLETPLFQPGFL